MGFPIRKFTDQSLLAAPRDLSQRATSFIASQCQGIHQMPFRRLISTPTKTLAPRAGTSLLATDQQDRCFRRSMLLPASAPCELAGRGASSVTCTSSSLVHDPAPAPRCGLGHMKRGIASLHVHVSVLWFLPTVLEAGRLSRPSTPSCEWWRQTGSNRRPPACKAGALPTALCPRWSRHR